MRAVAQSGLLALLLALVAPAAAETDLPGVSRDPLAAARQIDAPSSSPASAGLLTRERAVRWAPAIVLGAAALTVDLAAQAPDHPRWDTRNRFDDAFQDGLVASSSSGREAAAITSTVLLSALGAACAADLYLLRDDYALEQSLAVSLTATAATQLLSGTAKVVAGRERPYVRRCRANPGYSESCDSSDDNESFLSLHASQSATLASLLCTRRLRRHDRTWVDGLACGAAAATSAATGILRITADEHYTTDVLAGWGAGVLFGAALPLLFPGWSGIGSGDSSVTPVAGEGAFGFQYTSRF